MKGTKFVMRVCRHTHSVTFDFVTLWTVSREAPQVFPGRILEWCAIPSSRESS